MACCDSYNLCDRLVCHSGTDLCDTVGHWSLSHIKPCLNHIVVVSNQLWDQFDLSTPVTAVLSPYIKPCCDQSPEQGRHPNENISDVNFAKVQCQRQDRTVPRRGWWRRRCSSLHLLRKIFSLRPHQVKIETTPGGNLDAILLIMPIMVPQVI